MRKKDIRANKKGIKELKRKRERKIVKVLLVKDKKSRVGGLYKNRKWGILAKVRATEERRTKASIASKKRRVNLVKEVAKR